MIIKPEAGEGFSAVLVRLFHDGTSPLPPQLTAMPKLYFANSVHVPSYVYNGKRILIGDFVIHYENEHGGLAAHEWYKLLSMEPCNEYTGTINVLRAVYPSLSEISRRNCERHITRLELLKSGERVEK